MTQEIRAQRATWSQRIYGHRGRYGQRGDAGIRILTSKVDPQAVRAKFNKNCIWHKKCTQVVSQNRYVMIEICIFHLNL